jgi:hypothetical protein
LNGFRLKFQTILAFDIKYKKITLETLKTQIVSVVLRLQINLWKKELSIKRRS